MLDTRILRNSFVITLTTFARYQCFGLEYAVEKIKEFKLLDNSFFFSQQPRSGGRAYFSDGIYGHELWVTDGTQEGTMLVKDFASSDMGRRTLNLPGANGGSGFVSGSLNGKLLFRANGEQLWISDDGTPEGTRLVKDFFPGKITESEQSSTLWEFKNKAYFLADGGAHGSKNVQPWVTDGTESGTHIFFETDRDSTITSIRVLDTRILFLSDNHIWFSDGTREGTVKSRRLDRIFRATAEIGDLMYFLQGSQNQLFRSDGIDDKGISLVKEFSDGDRIVNIPRCCQKLPNKKIPIFASVNNIDEMWATDGTPAGTTFLKRLSPGYLFTFPVSTEKTLFWADDGVFPGDDLWETDGTEEGTRLLKEFSNNTYHRGCRLVGGNRMSDENTYGDALMMIHCYDDSTLQLWKSDGTISGTVKLSQNVRDSEAVTDSPVIITQLNETTYVYGSEEFNTYDSNTTARLMKIVAENDSDAPSESPPSEFPPSSPTISSAGSDNEPGSSGKKVRPTFKPTEADLASILLNVIVSYAGLVVLTAIGASYL